MIDHVLGLSDLRGKAFPLRRAIVKIFMTFKTPVTTGTFHSAKYGVWNVQVLLKIFPSPPPPCGLPLLLP